MSRLDKLDEILKIYENIQIDSEAFRKGNPIYSEWIKKLDESTKETLEKALSAIKAVVANYAIGDVGPFRNTALYVVGSSVKWDDFNDIDLLLVGLKQNFISDELVNNFVRHIQHYIQAKDIAAAKETIYSGHVAARMKFSASGKPIDFLIDRSGKTIKAWEQQQADAAERYVFIGSLGRKGNSFSW